MKKVILPFVASVVSGIFLYLAFPPVNDDRIAWFALVPSLVVARYVAPFLSFRYGLVTGCVFWLMSLSWLLQLGFTGTVWPLAVLAWVLLAVYSALYTGLFMAVSSWLFKVVTPDGWHEEQVHHSSFHGFRQGFLIILIPMVWVGFEYIRSVFLGGFPWNALGVSQYRNLAVIQLAELGGVYGVSAVVMVMNVALTFSALRIADVYHRRRTPAVMRFAMMAGLLVCACCWMYGVRRVHELRRENPSGISVRIAAVQPNTPQLKKWDEQFEYEIFERLDRQTRLASINDPDIIVWPETAVMRSVNEDEMTYKFIQNLVSLGAPLLVGSLESERPGGCSGSDSPRVWYNSSFLVGVDGTVGQRYRKQHLVPFGEYVPFENHVKLIQRIVPVGFSCIPGEESTVFDLALRSGRSDRMIHFGVLICFEDAFAYLARRSVRSGAEFLINQTNDAWFDGTAAAVQHMSHCVFRCVENRVPAVRSANTGITCFIDSTGSISYLSDTDGKYLQNVEGFKVSSIVVNPATESFYTRHGDIMFAMPSGIMSLVILAYMAFGRARKREGNP